MRARTDTPAIPARAAWITLAAAAAVAAFVTAGMCTGALTIGVDRQWTWDPKPTDRLWALPVTLFAFGVFLAALLAIGSKLAHADAKPRRGEDALLLGVLVVLGFALQLGVGQLSKAGLRDWPLIVAAPHTNGYFEAARHVDNAGAFLRDYDRLMPRLNFHCRTHPPGPMLYFLAAIRVFEGSPGLTRTASNMLRDSAFDTQSLMESFAQGAGLTLTRPQIVAAWASGMGLALLGVLGCIPLFVIAKRFYGREAGLWAAAIWLVSPCVLYFTPAVDQALASLCVLGGCLWIFAVGAATPRRAAVLASLSGLVMALALFVSISAAVCGAMLALWWAIRLWCEPARRRALGCVACCGAAGVVAFYGLVWLVTGHNSIATFAQILSVARENVRQGYIERPVQFTYGRWIFWNLVEFAIGLGWATAVCALAWGWRVGVRHALLLAFAATLLLLDVSGTSMSETGRLWMFIMWPAMLAAAGFLARVQRHRLAIGATMLTLLFAQSVALKLWFGWV